MNTPGCPPEEDLVPLVSGPEGTIDFELKGHVDHCPFCNERIDSLREAKEALCGWVARSTTPVGPGLIGQGSGSSADPEDPDTIGRYKVIGRIGSGGQAVVYRAVHPVLRREVVIKLGRQPLSADPALRERLVEEGRLLAQLDHPHLARIHDLDFQDGRPFLVLEYRPGRNLGQFAKDESPSFRRSAEIVARIGRALASAHRRGVVHRDIKPANILIGEDDRPCLIDFGIASLRDAWIQAGAAPGEISGTIEFMAPEQARGEADRVGPRSDIFALGGVLYFLLTGQAPFEGNTAQELMDRARRCDFDRGALRRKGAPGTLERICLKAMAADPAERFQTAEDMAKALERHLRRPLFLGAAAGVAALVLAVLLIVPAFRGGGELFRVEDVALWRISPQGKERLLEGSSIQVGDRISMEFLADRPVYVYVLNEDEKGHRSCLFPRSELKRHNPLAGGVRHILPDERQAWTVNTEGGREDIFLVASVWPIESLERGSLPGVEEVKADGIRTILRGIDGVTEIEVDRIAEGKARLSEVIDELKRTCDGGEARKGIWRRKVTLSNP